MCDRVGEYIMYYVVLAIQWVCIGILLTECWIVIINMKNKLHHYLFLSCAASLINSVGYILELYSGTEEAYFQALIVSWLGKIWIPLGLFLFITRLCRVRVSVLWKAILVLFNAVTLFVIMTTGKNGLFYKNMGFEMRGDFPVFFYENGPWHYVWGAVLLLYIVVGMVILHVSIFREKSALKRKQICTVMLAILVETVFVLLNMFNVLPTSGYYDVTILGFSIGAIFMFIAIIRDRLLDIKTLAKDYVIDELTAGVIAVDESGELVFYNHTATMIFPELMQTPYEVIDRIRRAVSESRQLNIEERIYTPEEKNIQQNGVNIGAIYALTDSTGHYRHMRELEEQREIANDANNAKSRFLASMSHEIRTPINSILGMDEMILRESREGDIRAYAMDIKISGHMLLNIINDILDLSKIEVGKMELVPVEYDVSEMIREMSIMMSTIAGDKNLSFEVRVDPDIPSTLFGDDVRIRQILTNILTNAIKYTREGSVCLKVALEGMAYDEDEDEKYAILQFEVEDTGIGIKPEDMDRLFGAYERIESENIRNIEGTGLGMAITVKMLELMNSRLNVDSEYGRGSVFAFELRQRIVDETPVGSIVDRDEPPEERHEYYGSFLAPDAQLLVVDDNAMNRKVVEALLKPTRVKITGADGGYEAVKLAGEKHYDIIFMDHMMPDIDGVEAMKMIRSDALSLCASTPIFVMTANAVKGAREQYEREGFDGYLAKPIEPERLEEIIRKALPAEKLQKPELSDPKKAEVTRPGDGFDVRKKPVIFGLDWWVALMQIQDEDTVVELLSDFAAGLELQADKLQKLKEESSGTLEEYRIMVHGMKSASGAVGLTVLSGMAALLEKAAAEGDQNTIDRLHDVFISEWRSYKERLRELFDTGEDKAKDRQRISGEMLELLLGVISDSTSRMDVDEADLALSKLMEYTLPAEAAASLDELRAAVVNLDDGLVGEVVERMRAKVQDSSLRSE